MKGNGYTFLMGINKESVEQGHKMSGSFLSKQQETIAIHSAKVMAIGYWVTCLQKEIQQLNQNE
jgi:hypothetical protein